MTRIRVLRVIARLNVGGPALQLQAIANGLDRTRFEHRVLIGSVGPDEMDFRALRGDLHAVEIAGLGRALRPLDDLRAISSLRQEIRRFRPHVVHTHTAKAGLVGRLATWTTTRAPTVHTFHGHLLHGYGSRMLSSGARQVERALARRTTRLVAVGARVRDELVAAGIGRPSQYLVVPPGIPALHVPPRDSARSDLGIAPDAEVVCFAGRLTTVKRPDRLEAVARLVLDARPEAIVIVAGEGDLFASLRAGTADLGPRFRLLGWRGDIGTVFAASDVVLLTSDNEGMPVSLIEAGMAGIPAVTTDVGSVREVVLDGETGVVCPPDAEPLAHAVCWLLDDQRRREAFGRAARRHTTGSFGPDRLVADLEALYESLAASQLAAGGS